MTYRGRNDIHRYYPAGIPEQIMGVLTRRQQQIARLREEGLREQEIIEQLNISKRCYWQHRINTREKLEGLGFLEGGIERDKIFGTREQNLEAVPA